MLQTMRHLAQHWLFKGLMLFLVISFSIWGIGDIFRGNPLQRTVAKVGKMAISVQSLNSAFEQALGRARQMFGPDITPQQARQMGVLDETLNNLIEHAAVEQDVGKLGLDVADKAVLDRLAQQPQLRDKDGKFNKEMFQTLLARSNTNERGFIDNARKEMAQQQLIDALQSGGAVPKFISDNVTRALGQKRVLDIVSVKNDSFKDIPPPDDQVLNDFYQQNAQKFMAPEYRGLTLVKLSTDDLAKDINISDDDVKKQYDAKAADYVQPEHRDLLQVVVQDEAKAKQIAASARTDHDLAKAAKAAGHDAVPLNGVDEKTTLPELAKSAFALPAGQISDPIKTSLGWHVVQVKKITPAGKRDFDSVKNELRDSMKRDQAIENTTRIVNTLDDQLAAGHALEDIADSLKLRLVKIPAVDASGKTADGKAPAELPDQDEVLKSAFSQGSGETSPVLDDKQGNYIVVRTDDITPSAVPAFDKIKDQIIAGWKKVEQAKRASAAAEDIAKNMRDGKAASSFAAQTGVDVRVSKPVSMLGENDPDLPQTVLPQVFKMKKNEVAVMPLPDKQLVLRLIQYVDIDPAEDDKDADKVKSELNSRAPNEITAQYVKYLRMIFPVEINEGLLETLRQQGS